MERGRGPSRGWLFLIPEAFRGFEKGGVGVGEAGGGRGLPVQRDAPAEQ